MVIIDENMHHMLKYIDFCMLPPKQVFKMDRAKVDEKLDDDAFITDASDDRCLMSVS